MNKPLNVGIVGSRRRNQQKDYELIEETVLRIRESHPDMVIVSGGCKEGADHFAELIAFKFKIPIRIHYPDKTKLNQELIEKKKFKAAYAIINFERNTLIAQDSDILLACVADDRKGGTEDTVKKFKKLHPEGYLILI